MDPFFSSRIFFKILFEKVYTFKKIKCLNRSEAELVGNEILMVEIKQCILEMSC